jgi:hypothetical protein
MASWAVLTEQIVWISPAAIAFTVVCDRCVEDGDPFPSVQAALSLEHARGSIECHRGHLLRVERDGR